MAGLALAASFPAVCPVGIALTRRAAGRCVREGGYSFYRAAF